MTEVDSLPIHLPSELPSADFVSEGILSSTTSTEVANHDEETEITKEASQPNNGMKKTKTIIRKKRRPARPQVDPATLKSLAAEAPQTGTIFNIWFNKWSGGDREDKHSDYRDDMGGVGSFMRQNRTLYVGRIHVTDDIEEIVARNFQEWGQIDRVRCLTARGVAFVTYTNEANSQFAKEAMAHQSLDHEEILNVRWATVDPNPQAQKREARAIEEQAAEAVRRALPAEFVKEIEGDPEARKRKKLEGGFGLEGYEAPDDVWYARNRALESDDRGTAFLEGGERKKMLENGTPEQAVNAQENGILKSSTIATLRQRDANQEVAAARPIPLPETRQPALVAYGSDDDSD
ncbi:uncharacterized protein KY384_003714 [Bacidia gigantensis]|uniref:uncharacterized protein n=1 Tax=Bacidia gigantensis TaxID=2732470 RepID=UPI001D059B27|nr:uncharacterized protein KY384_003714 [Bacidia gigantensis]KAG8532077.1 hypothetical protein KY384_003714 [Bacidia gigantensis]